MSTRILFSFLLSLLLFPLLLLAQSSPATPTLMVTTTVTSTPSPTPTPVVTPFIERLINIGDIITEFFSGTATSATYYFEGRAGQYISISLQIELSFTNLHLLDPDGLELTRGTFIDAPRGIEIPAAYLPKDGIYTIAIDRSEGLNTYTLKLNNLDVQDIAYGQTIDGVLSTDKPAILYRFQGNRFDTIDLSLTSTDFDAYVTLHQASGDRLTGDDNNGGGRNAFLGLRHLLENDDYLIRVDSKNGFSTGEFQLRLNHAAFKPLGFGDSLEVNFTQDMHVAYFAFQGLPGDVINLSVQSGGRLDTLMRISDPGYLPGFEDDDSGTGFDPEIGPWFVREKGTYQVMLRPYQIGSEGKVILTLSRAELPSLDRATQEVVLTSKRPIGMASFQGKMGEQIRLTITVDPLMDNSPDIVVVQDGEVLASSAGGLPSSTLVFAVPSDGTVVVQLTDAHSGPGTVQLSLQRTMP